MRHAESTFRILYVSQLAPGQSFTTLKQIAAVARVRNPESRITGALLFDGERFCQLIEGPEADVKALMVAIALDPRHTDVRLLFEAPVSGERIMTRWVSGYCEPRELDRFAAGTELHGQAALLAFGKLLVSADTE